MPQSNPIFLYFFLFLLTTGCIEPYVPNLSGGTEEVYVITGEITDQTGYQYVALSMASAIDKPLYIPVKGGQLDIEDDKGHIFSMEEYQAGLYRVWIDSEYLQAGNSYRLRVITSSGVEIISDYDKMPQCPVIDSLYYLRENRSDRHTGETVTGIQFYIDFQSSDNDSRHYQWTIVETWEIHSPYPLEHYYDGTWHNVSPPDYSYKVCWVTDPVNTIYLLSTDILATNGYKGLPLHFVDNTTTKLYIGYSALITLHALSDQAYIFWDQMKKNSGNQGSLYETQPLPVEGNLHNVTKSEKQVLGFFSASAVSRKRVFVDAIRDMGISYDSICNPYPLGQGGWKQFSRFEYPVYYTYIDEKLRILSGECVDCRLSGGSLIKPEFWPE